MRAILLSDTHMGIKNSNKLYLNLTYNLFKEVADYCNVNNISNIIHCGDMFHTRYSINILTLSYSYKIIELLKKNNIHIYICIGNHDLYYKSLPEPNTLMVLNKYDNVTIINEPTEFDHEIICP